MQVSCDQHDRTYAVADLDGFGDFEDLKLCCDRVRLQVQIIDLISLQVATVIRVCLHLMCGLVYSI